MSREEIQLSGWSPNTKKQLLDSELAGEIATLLPTRFQLHTSWTLKYSLEQHGASLRTLYELAAPPRGDRQSHGYVLVVEDAKGGRLGAYINETVKPTEGAHYSGNGDCFLWKKPYRGSFRGFKYTGKNDFVMFNTHVFLSLGGGEGHYGLWLDDDLNNGVSYSVPTFSNEELSVQGPKFQVVSAELWQV